jgi:hypothetical protein
MNTKVIDGRLKQIGVDEPVRKQLATAATEALPALADLNPKGKDIELDAARSISAGFRAILRLLGAKAPPDVLGRVFGSGGSERMGGEQGAGSPPAGPVIVVVKPKPGEPVTRGGLADEEPADWQRELWRDRPWQK